VCVCVNGGVGGRGSWGHGMRMLYQRDLSVGLVKSLFTFFFFFFEKEKKKRRGKKDLFHSKQVSVELAQQ